MREVQFGRAHLARGVAFKIVLVFGAELARHQGGNLGVVAQVQNGLARLGVGDMGAAVFHFDLGGFGRQAVLVAVFADHVEPGLLDKLKQPGGRRGLALAAGLKLLSAAAFCIKKEKSAPVF